MPRLAACCRRYAISTISPARWQPGKPPPQDLFDHIAGGGLVEAHNWLFEFALWHYVCRRLYGWPALPMHQMRCSAAKRVASSPAKR